MTSSDLGMRIWPIVDFDGEQVGQVVGPAHKPAPAYLCAAGPEEPCHFVMCPAGHYHYRGPCREADHGEGTAGVAAIVTPDPDQLPPNRSWLMLVGAIVLTALILACVIWIAVMLTLAVI